MLISLTKEENLKLLTLYNEKLKLIWVYLIIVEKDGKALKLKYQDKLRIVAYTKQATYGKYRNDVSPEVGFLDVVGNDRR